MSLLKEVCSLLHLYNHETIKFFMLKLMSNSFFSIALTWLRGTIEVHDEMDEMRAEYESMKMVPKVRYEYTPSP